jgi:hypothetical protein
MANWTKELPTKPGFYWVCDVNTSIYPHVYEPEVIECVQDFDEDKNPIEGQVYFLSTGLSRFECDHIGSRQVVWDEPISPPSDTSPCDPVARENGLEKRF